MYDKIHATRYPELGYAKIRAGLWMVIDLSYGNPAQVGPHYATKDELLADFTRYSDAWFGFDRVAA